MLSRQQHLNGELAQAMNTKLANHKSTLALAAGKLNALSPLSTLDRGYAIVRDAGGSVITNAVQTQPGQHITVRFAENQITAEVIESAANKK